MDVRSAAMIYVVPCIRARERAIRNPFDKSCIIMSGRLQSMWQDLGNKFHEVGCDVDQNHLDDLLAAICFDGQVYCADPFTMMAVAAHLEDWGLQWALVVVHERVCRWVPQKVMRMATRAVKADFTGSNTRYFEEARCEELRKCWVTKAWVPRSRWQPLPLDLCMLVVLVSLMLQVV